MWPAIADAVQDIIKKTESSVVVVEAAVLLTANWQDLCHEVLAFITILICFHNFILFRFGLHLYHQSRQQNV